MATDANAALASAHKALDSANNFVHKATGGAPDAFAPKPAAAKPTTDYGHARAARSTNVGDELKAKQDNVIQYTKSE